MFQPCRRGRPVQPLRHASDCSHLSKLIQQLPNTNALVLVSRRIFYPGPIIFQVHILPKSRKPPASTKLIASMLLPFVLPIPRNAMSQGDEREEAAQLLHKEDNPEAETWLTFEVPPLSLPTKALQALPLKVHSAVPMAVHRSSQTSCGKASCCFPRPVSKWFQIAT